MSTFAAQSKRLKASSKKSTAVRYKQPALHRYQDQAANAMVKNQCHGLFMEPGLGKTRTTLTAFKRLRDKGEVEAMLVIAPLHVCYNVWPREVQKWKEFNGLEVAILHGPKKKQALDTEADIYLINPEGLPWFMKQRRVYIPDMLVIDESTKFKNNAAKRTKLLKAALPMFKRRYILTGTPTPNGLLDLFSQVYILDMGERLGKYITHYRNRWFMPTGYGGYTWVPRAGAGEEIKEQLEDIVTYMKADDYLELPPLVENDVVVDLPDDVYAMYKEFEEEFVLQLEKEDIIAKNAGVLTGKLQQVANGGIYTTADRAKWETLHMAKAEAVADIVEEASGQPCLVAYHFNHDLDRLKKVLGKDTPHIGKGVTAKRVREIEREWNRGKIPVLLANPASVAHGLNMQEAGRHVIWHSLTWNSEHYTQFIQRVWRQGQKDTVFLHHIIAAGTIDRLIRRAEIEKISNQQQLLDFFRKEFL